MTEENEKGTHFEKQNDSTWDNTYTFEERTELNFDDVGLKVWILLRRMDELEVQIAELKGLLQEHKQHKLIL